MLEIFSSCTNLIMIGRTGFFLSVIHILTEPLRANRDSGVKVAKI